MKTGTIKYSQEFKLIDGSTKWWGIELEFNMDSEDPADVAEKARSLVYKFAQSSVPGFPDNSIPPGPPPVIQVKPEDREIGLTVEWINGFTDHKALSEFKLLVKGKPDLEEAYLKKLNELMTAKK